MGHRGNRHTAWPALAAAAVMAITVACGGGAPAESNQTSQATAAAPKATASAAASGGATAPAAGATTGDPLLARGKEIFDKTAGGVGCAACHGLDGKGNGPANVGAPPNRGLDEAKVRAALSGVELMKIVKLNDDEIKAVVSYLDFLGKQP